jgi:hypothetical protein
VDQDFIVVRRPSSFYFDTHITAIAEDVAVGFAVIDDAIINGLLHVVFELST